MYAEPVRKHALRRLTEASLSQVSRETGVSRSTLRVWRDQPRLQRSGCPNCDLVDLPTQSYAALLGFYLGDGCISQQRRYFSLRIACDRRYPGVIADAEGAIRAVRNEGKVFLVRAPGVVVVQANWVHWPCLFPQHGPGRKHERPILLEPWQADVVREHPADFLRGLFHSDGCRTNNWATRVVAGQRKRYEYPRWHFTNNSGDIRFLCGWALDLVDIPWRTSNWKTLSVSRREAVRRLDELIGPKA